MANSQKTEQRIEEMLRSANGSGRERLLAKREIAQVLTEAMSELEYGYTTGGSVGRSYKDRAYSTAAFALANGPDYIALRIERVSAKGSAVTWAGPKSIRESDIRKWTACQTLYTLRSWIVLTRREAKHVVRVLVGIKIPKGLPVVSVMLADSLNAGNCRMTSERVAGWFAPVTEVPSKKLLTEIQRREPLLMPFALRAITTAAKRQLAVA